MAKAGEAARRIPNHQSENLKIRNSQIQWEFWLVRHSAEGVFSCLCNLHQPPLRGDAHQCKVRIWCWSKLRSTDLWWKFSGHYPMYATLLQELLKVYVSKKWVISHSFTHNPKALEQDNQAYVAQDIVGSCTQCNHQYSTPSSQWCPQHIWEPSYDTQREPSKGPHWFAWVQTVIGKGYLVKVLGFWVHIPTVLAPSEIKETIYGWYLKDWGIRGYLLLYDL